MLYLIKGKGAEMERKEKQFRERITRIKDNLIIKENKLKAEILKNISLNKNVISFNDISDLKIDLELFGKEEK